MSRPNSLYENKTLGLLPVDRYAYSPGAAFGLATTIMGRQIGQGRNGGANKDKS